MRLCFQVNELTDWKITLRIYSFYMRPKLCWISFANITSTRIYIHFFSFFFFFLFCFVFGLFRMLALASCNYIVRYWRCHCMKTQQFSEVERIKEKKHKMKIIITTTEYTKWAARRKNIEKRNWIIFIDYVQASIWSGLWKCFEKAMKWLDDVCMWRSTSRWNIERISKLAKFVGDKEVAKFHSHGFEFKSKHRRVAREMRFFDCSIFFSPFCVSKQVKK